MVGSRVSPFLRRIFSVGSPLADLLSRISFDGSFQSDLLQQIFSVRSPPTDLLSWISSGESSQSDLLQRIFSTGSSSTDLLNRFISYESSLVDLLRRSSIRSHQPLSWNTSSATLSSASDRIKYTFITSLGHITYILQLEGEC